LVLLLAACTGCSGAGFERGPTEAEQLATLSMQVTLESVHRMGPHVFTAATTTTELGATDVEHMELLWGDWDNFRDSRWRNDASPKRVILVKGVGFTGTKGKPHKRWADAQAHRTQLSSTWNRFEDALSPFLASMELVPLDDDLVVEGRPAASYTVQLAEAPVAAGKWEPTSLTGTVVLDVSTAVRLSADVTGTLRRPDKDQERVVHLALSRSDIGVVPEIKKPARVAK
jgi:hypothetical protein